jgi:hypothetical protein
MALQYISNVASKAKSWNSKPILTDEDEAFLERVMSREEHAEGVKPAGNDAQVALMDGAQEIPLPVSPTEELTVESSLAEKVAEKPAAAVAAAAEPVETKKKSRPWSMLLKRSGTQAKKVYLSLFFILADMLIAFLIGQESTAGTRRNGSQRDSDCSQDRRGRRRR